MSFTLRRLIVTGLVTATVALTACSATPTEPTPTPSVRTNEWWTVDDYPKQIGAWEFRPVLGQPTYQQSLEQRVGVTDYPGPYTSLQHFDSRVVEVVPGVGCTPDASLTCNVLFPDGRVVTCLNVSGQTRDVLARECKELTDGIKQK
ncbi:MAG: hypothetical protein Q4F65_12720 [Propionibacteriaceae bacterium]|nr:hypothetical protein [Propionibacteriaceae bacterium]